MPSPVDLENFAHQTKVVNATATMNPKLWDTVQDAGTPLSFVTGRAGVGKALRVTLDGVNASRVVRNLVTPGTLLVASFDIRLISIPTGASARVFHAFADTFGVISINTSGQLQGAWTTGTITIGTGASIIDGAWHTVDVRFDSSGTTHTTDWYVDGVLQPQGFSSALVAASNFTLWGVGNNLGTATATFDIGNLVVSQTTGDFPLGRHAVYSIVPNADNAASVYGTNIMEQGDGTDLTASNPAWQYLDEWPPTSPGVANNADTVTQAATGAGNFADVEFENTPNWAAGGAWGVRGLVAHQSDGTLADNGTTRIVDSAGATLTDIYTGDMSETSAHYTAKMITAPSTGWTQAALDGVRARIGFSSDGSPQPEWLALMLQVAVPMTPPEGEVWRPTPRHPLMQPFNVPLPISVRQQFEPGAGTVFTQAIDIGMTLTVAAVKQVNKVTALGATFSAAVAKQVNKITALGATMTPAVTKQANKNVALGATLTPAVTKRVNKNIAVAMTLTVATAASKLFVQVCNVGMTLTVAGTRQVNKVVALGTTLTTAVTKRVNKNVAVPATFNVTMAKRVGKNVAIVLTAGLAAAENFISHGGTTPQAINIAVTYAVSVATRVIPKVGAVNRRISGQWRPVRGRGPRNV